MFSQKFPNFFVLLAFLAYTSWLYSFHSINLICIIYMYVRGVLSPGGAEFFLCRQRGRPEFF